jgi:hypothetical protein
MSNNDLHYFRVRMFFFATIIAAGCALAIPGFNDQPAIQLKLALIIPCVLAGAWSLPPVLLAMMREMIRAYESLTGRRVRD